MTVANQAYIFLYSCIGGMLIAFVYDLFRIKRKTFKSKSSLSIYLEDFLYWLIVSGILFIIFYSSNDGELRGFIILGILLGVILYILLLSKIVTAILMWVIKFLFKIIYLFVLMPLKILIKIFKRPTKFLIRKCKGLIKKVKKILKFVYTKIFIWKKIFKNSLKKT